MKDSQEYDPAVDSTLYVNEILRLVGDNMSVRGWVLGQMHEWNWLAQIDSDLSNIHSLLFNGVLQTARENTELNPCNVTVGSKSEPFIDAFSEVGLYIKEIIEKHGEITAAFFVAYYYPHSRKLVTQAMGETLRLLASEHFYESGLALQLLLSLELSTDDANQDNTSLQSIQRKQTSNYLKDLNSSKAFVEKKAHTLIEEFDKKKSAFTDAFQLEELNTRKTLSRYQKITKRGLRWTASKMQKAETEWNITKARLKEQLEIDQSVAHWKKQESSHATAKWRWLSAVVLLMFATTSLMLCYYAKGGISGIFPSQPIASNINQISNEPNKTNTTLTVAPQANGKISIGNLSADTQVIASIAANISGAILMLTLLVTLMRIALRRYSINAMLTENAAERLAFIKTYLSLMDEGKLDSREDRILVLQALFRSSSQAMASDPHIASPIELILKPSQTK